MTTQTVLLAGTRKGLVVLSSPDRRTWDVKGPFLAGKEINHAARDPRTGRIFATANDAWFGPEIVWSDDLGESWTSAKQSPVFAKGSGNKLDRIWHVEPGREDEPDVLYAGVAPAALFRSVDGGQHWDEVAGLSNHPTRERWQPGAGGLCLHSIVLDPANAQRMWVGISAVGVFLTEDGGQTWATRNKGVRAEFQPDKYPEFGQCVHKLLPASARGDALFQQNHCGVYRSTDAGGSWQEITAGLPSDFGFPLAVYPHAPETIFVIPLQGGEFRCPPELSLRVYRSSDGGGTWEALSNGLPQTQTYCEVYREGLATDAHDPAGVYFGTNTGKIFASLDQGESWTTIADNLPPISSVEASL